MLLRHLFESKNASVGIIFGRFNPPHQGHRAAWEMAAQNDKWFVGTNQSTQGPKDPLPYNVKIKAMQAVWPEIKGHIVPETSWLTLASKVYNEYGSIVLNVYTDEEWVTKTLIQYNGVKGAHGFYNFKNIDQKPTPRLSSATALRAAVQAGDRDAFARAAGVDANTSVGGKPFFDVVAHFLAPYSTKPAPAPKKKIKDKSVAEMDSQGYTGTRDRKRTSKYGSRDDYELGKGKEGTGKPLTAKQMMDKAHKAMMKSMSDAEKVDKGWRNPNLKEYGDTAKGQKMLTKVQKRAVDRVTSKKADTDPAYAKKNKDTADRAWDRMTDKDVAEGNDPLQNRADYAKKHGQGQVYKKTYPGDKVGMTKTYAYDVKRTGPKGQLPKEDVSKAMAHTAKSLENPPKVMQHRAKRDQERERQYMGTQLVKRDRTSKDEWGNFRKDLAELSSDMLGRYKKAASADASKADKEGNFEKGNKRFKGIVKATNKQFDNDMKGKK